MATQSVSDAATGEESEMPSGLRCNLGLLDAAERALALSLLASRQSHLFDGWDPPGTNDEHKRAFLDQVASFDAGIPGGIARYLDTIRALSDPVSHPPNGSAPSAVSSPPGSVLSAAPHATSAPPPGVQLTPMTEQYEQLEQRGLTEAVHLAFILSPPEQIIEPTSPSSSPSPSPSPSPLSEPVEISTGASSLEINCSAVAALQQLLKRRLGRAVILPLLLLAPEETHAHLLQLLSSHGHFGLSPSQLTLLAPPLVPCLVPGAHALLAREGAYKLSSQQLGPGAVHALLAASAIPQRWGREGVRWLIFLHDGCAMHLPTHLPTLGLAATAGLDLCFAATRYRPGMGLDVIAKINRKDMRGELLAPVSASEVEGRGEEGRGGESARCAGTGKQRGERAAWFGLAGEGKGVREREGEGEGEDKREGSGFACHANCFVTRLDSYVDCLSLTSGLVGDLSFSPHGVPRLLSRVQDYAKLLPPTASVDYALLPPELGCSPCLYPLPTAAALSARGLPPCCAGSAEMGVYRAHCATLRMMGASVASPRERSFHGVRVPLGPSVVLHSSFVPCMGVLRHHLPSPPSICVSERSTLLVRGHQLLIDELSLDGMLELSVAQGASLRVRSLHVTNEGWQFDEISHAVMGCDECPPVLRTRGYTLRKRGGRRVVVSQPGAWEVVSGELVRVSEQPEELIPTSPPSTPKGGRTTTIPAPHAKSVAIGGPLLGSSPPPASAVWSSSALTLSPGAFLSVPLVLREPSIAYIQVNPDTTGLFLSLLPVEGAPLLPPSSVARLDGGFEQVHVPGSGVYTLHLQNRNLLTPVCFSAKVEHVPAADLERSRLQEALAMRCEELKLVQKQTGELAVSEAELARRLWEVQEMRRRHEEIGRQLQSSIQAITESL